MIAMYLRPDKTQILQVDIGKDLKASVTSAMETAPVLDAIIKPHDENPDDRLTEFFTALKRDTDAASENIYLVLPDYLFSYIESVDYVSESNLQSLIKEKTDLSEDQLYIVAPVETASPAPERKSVYAIRREIVDNIAAAYTRERLALVSIEPASLSFFRAYAKYDIEMPVVEMFKDNDNAIMVTYSPAGGIYGLDAASIAEPALLKDLDSADLLMQEKFVANVFAAGDTFMNVNPDMPHIILSENKQILDLSAVKIRSPEEPVNFPSFVTNYALEKEQERNWLVVLGTVFQVYDEVKSDGSNKYASNPATQGKPTFVKFTDGNLLPEEAKQAARARQWKQVLMRGCKKFSTIFSVLLAIEVALSLYFSGCEIDRSTREQYAVAKAGLADAKKEIGIIRSAYASDFQIPKLYAAILAHRPDGCGFASMTLGDNNAKDNDARAALNFVKFSAIAADEMMFQDFRENLAEDENFTGPSINTIQRDASSGLKKAAFTVGRVVKK